MIGNALDFLIPIGNSTGVLRVNAVFCPAREVSERMSPCILSAVWVALCRILVIASRVEEPFFVFESLGIPFVARLSRPAGGERCIHQMALDAGASSEVMAVHFAVIDSVDSIGLEMFPSQ
jgi:hypothetical protein